MAKQQAADPGASGNGSEDRYARYEQELADYLQERIEPGLDRDEVQDLARSIASDLARKRRPGNASEDTAEDDEALEDADDEARDDADDEYDEAEADAEPDDEYDDEDEADADDEDDGYDDEDEDEDEEGSDAEEEVSAFEQEMRELQADLGDDWIVRFSVQGDNAWLTAEKEDGSQHVEAPTADVLREAVDLLEGS